MEFQSLNREKEKFFKRVCLSKFWEKESSRVSELESFGKKTRTGKVWKESRWTFLKPIHKPWLFNVGLIRCVFTIQV